MNQPVRQLTVEAPPRECGVRGSYYFWWNNLAMMWGAAFPGEVLGNDLRHRGEFKRSGVHAKSLSTRVIRSIPEQKACSHITSARELVPRPSAFI